MKELLQQALDLLSEVSTLSANSRYDNLPDGLLTRIDELRALAQKARHASDEAYFRKNLDYANALIDEYRQLVQGLLSQKPVAVVEVGQFDHGPFIFKETGYGADALWSGAVRALFLAPQPEPGDIRALKHRIHELEGEVIGYKRILEEQQEQPAQEPVEYQARVGKDDWRKIVAQQGMSLLQRVAYLRSEPGYEVRELYAAPTQPALSDADIAKFIDQDAGLPDLVGMKDLHPAYRRFARAVEAHCRGGVNHG